MDTVTNAYAPHFPDCDVADLRRRIKDARLPTEETAAPWVQGVPLVQIMSLLDHWLNEYDFADFQMRMDGLPHRMTRIGGMDVHFLHFESGDPDAVPLLLTHGWPSSFLEFVELAKTLSDPSRDVTYNVVIPSLPGHGFSGTPEEEGMGVAAIARLWVELMGRLGYQRFVAHGGDWGSYITALLGADHADAVLGIHLTMPFAPKPIEDIDLDDRDQAALKRMMGFGSRRSGYASIQHTRPQTLAYGLEDSPVGHLAWIFERYWEWVDHSGDLFTVIAERYLLDTVTLYWLQRSAGGAARLFWESFYDQPRDVVRVPTVCTVTPNDAWMPRSWCEQRFVNIVSWKDLPEFGHYLALEAPNVLAAEIDLLTRHVVSVTPSDVDHAQVEDASSRVAV